MINCCIDGDTDEPSQKILLRLVVKEKRAGVIIETEAFFNMKSIPIGKRKRKEVIECPKARKENNSSNEFRLDLRMFNLLGKPLKSACKPKNKECNTAKNRFKAPPTDEKTLSKKASLSCNMHSSMILTFSFSQGNWH